MPAESNESIREFIDIPAVKKQYDALYEMLQSLYKKLLEVNSVKINLGNSGKPSEIVQGITQLDNAVQEVATNTKAANTQLDKLVETAKKSIPTYEQQRKILDNISGTLDQNIRLQVQYRTRLKEISEEIKKLEKATADNGRESDAYKTKLAALVKEQQTLKAASQDVNTNVRNQIKELNTAGGSINQMRARLNQLQQAYEALSEAEKKSGTGQQLKTSIDDLLPKVKQAEEGVGKFSRNVGNYSSAAMSLSQVVRELPSFTNSVQTGLMGISNNLPILIDNFKKTKEETGSTTKALGVFGKSLFSFTNIFTLLFTAFMLVSDKVVAAVKDAFQSMTFSVKDATKSLNEEVQKSFQNVSEQSVKLDILRDRATKAGLSFKEKQRILEEYNKEFGDTLGKARDFNEAESNLVNKTDAYIQALVLRSRAQAALNLAMQKQEEIFKLMADPSKQGRNWWDDIVAHMSKITSDPFFEEQAGKNAEKRAKDRSRKMEQEKAYFEGLYKDIMKSVSGMEDQFKFKTDPGDGGDGMKKYYEKLQQQIEGQIILLKERAEVLKNIAENDREAYSDRIKALGDLGQVEKKIVELEAKKRLSVEEITAQQIKNIRLQLKIDKEKIDRDTLRSGQKLTEEEAKRRYEAGRQIQEVEKQKLEAIAANEKSLFVERFDAIRKSQEVEQALIESDYAFKVKTGKLTNDEILALATERDQKIVQLAADTQKRLSELTLNESTRLKALRDQQTEGAISQFDAEALAISSGYTKLYADELSALNESLRAKELTYEQYLNQRKKLDEKYSTDLLQLELDTLKKKAAILTLEPKERASINARIYELEKTLAEKSAEIFAQLSSKKNDVQRQFYSELQNLSQTIALATYENEKNAIQDQIDQLDRKRAKDIEVAQQTITNEQQKAAAVAVINASADAQKQVLEQRQRQVDQKRAVFERVFKGFQIASSVIESVAKIKANAAVLASNPLTLPFVPVALSQIPFVIGVGAAQVAALAATPIPKYRTGVESSPEGFAIVGDGGKPEVIEYPSGETFITPAKDTLAYLPERSRVYPDVDDFVRKSKAFAAAENGGAVQVNGLANDERSVEILINKISAGLLELKHAVKNKKELHLNTNRGDITAVIKQAQNTIEYINDNVQF